MSRLLRLASLIAAAGALSGCAGLYTGDPYPVADRSPNPAPVPGYRVKCQSDPGPFTVLDDDFVAGCQGYVGPSRRTTVIRAKG